jgi:hypothetical protein
MRGEHEQQLASHASRGVLLAKAGGLRILGRLNARGKAETIPQAELLADEKRNAQALSIALDPLLGTVAPTPGS